MPSCHLSCPGCHIRVRAGAPEIAILEGNCPICGATLLPALSAASVMGFRSFDLDLFAEQDVSHPPITAEEPVDLASRRERASARDAANAERWSDDGQQCQ
jgi:hypothetical protein